MVLGSPKQLAKPNPKPPAPPGMSHLSAEAMRSFDLTDREQKSARFNNMQVGDTVVIRQNNRTGHHDVTGKRTHLHDKQATVLGTASWPNTWLKLKMDVSKEVVKVRTSNIMLLRDWEKVKARGDCPMMMMPPPKPKPKPEKSKSAASHILCPAAISPLLIKCQPCWSVSESAASLRVCGH
jgi:hypothetical protein